MHDHFYSELEFPVPAVRPLIACNMVSSLDGKVTADGNQPASLGSSFDRRTMGVIRSHFDAVLAGGNTVRLHPYYLGVPRGLEEFRKGKGLAHQPLTVLLTKSGNLDPLTPLFEQAPRPPVIITSASGAGSLPPEIKRQARVEILAEASPEAILSLLQEKYQVQRLLLEGGPSVNYQFMQAKCLDELFLTLHPGLIGKRTDLGLAAGDEVLDKAARISLVSVHQQGDELYLRYRIAW